MRDLIKRDRPQEVVAFDGPSLVFGRDANCDQVLDFPMVSSRHASLTRTAKGFLLEDLASTDGTFLNGEEIHRPVAVRPGDIIGLGSLSFTVTEQGALEKRDAHGKIAIEARSVSVNVGRKRLIDDVSLSPSLHVN